MWTISSSYININSILIKLKKNNNIPLIKVKYISIEEHCILVSGKMKVFSAKRNKY